MSHNPESRFPTYGPGAATYHATGDLFERPIQVSPADRPTTALGRLQQYWREKDRLADLPETDEPIPMSRLNLPRFDSRISPEAVEMDALGGLSVIEARGLIMAVLRGLGGETSVSAEPAGRLGLSPAGPLELPNAWAWQGDLDDYPGAATAYEGADPPTEVLAPLKWEETPQKHGLR